MVGRGEEGLQKGQSDSQQHGDRTEPEMAEGALGRNHIRIVLGKRGDLCGFLQIAGKAGVHAKLLLFLETIDRL